MRVGFRLDEWVRGHGVRGWLNDGCVGMICDSSAGACIHSEGFGWWGYGFYDGFEGLCVFVL